MFSIPEVGKRHRTMRPRRPAASGEGAIGSPTLTRKRHPTNQAAHQRDQRRGDQIDAEAGLDHLGHAGRARRVDNGVGRGGDRQHEGAARRQGHGHDQVFGRHAGRDGDRAQHRQEARDRRDVRGQLGQEHHDEGEDQNGQRQGQAGHPLKV